MNKVLLLLLLSSSSVVVVVVDDDTDYWVYLSSEHLFQLYYKVRQVLLQSATAFFITKCDKCYYKVRQVLQSATIITKCDSTYTPVVSSKTIPDSRLKWLQSVPVFRPKRRKNHTLWGRHIPIWLI